MLLFVLAFLLGDLYLQTLAHLPSKNFLLACVAVGLIISASLYKRWGFAWLIFAFTLGFVYSAWFAMAILAWSLPKADEGKTIILTGSIASLPQTTNSQTSFLLAFDHGLARLTWRNNNRRLCVGDRWQLHVRVKRIHGLQNPGGFDFEAWALQKGLRMTGYVDMKANNMLLSHHWYRYPIDHFRQKLQDHIRFYSPKTHTSPWLMALIVGEREGIASEDWQVLRKTGTNHLMAIAGLHIGLIASFTHIIFRWLWRRIPFFGLHLPAHLAGAGAAWFVAVVYSALSGFSIPTQRACIMLTIIISTLFLRRKINIWHAWSLAMLVVLVFNPLTVLTDSFWLSFGTIALIIYNMRGRLAPTGFWWRWGRIQWIISLGLLPLTLFLFQECSLLSFFANTIAIPWLGLFILPLCFLSGILLFTAPSWASILLSLADKSLSGLWVFLAWIAQLPSATWQQVIPTNGLLALLIGGLLLLMLPTGFPGRWLGILWLMPFFMFKVSTPARGEYWMTLLDVGQGLSVVVQTRTHTLIFDTGAKLNSHFDVGESVVLPYLHKMSIDKIDMMVISHTDNDHIGGASAIIKEIPVLAIKSSARDKLLPSSITSACQAGDVWQWDGVNFNFLHPTPANMGLGNDSSCVLRIDNGAKKVLLTGDIEKYAEKEIIDRDFSALSADVLVAPHHGSKTSAIPAFIHAVHPQYILYPVGYRNRYNFPHKSVVDAYEKINAQQLNTAQTGAIMFKFDQKSEILPPLIYRVVRHRYWLD